MKKIIYTFLAVLLSAVCVQAQNVNIPDANFKAYLVGNAAINTNMDTEIQVSEATAFNGMIDCGNLNIADLTGIEAFTALTQLFCSQNQLTSLDVSQNVDLFNLNCSQNLLTSLDVSNNTDLQDLRCNNNPFSTTLDVSNNTALQVLYCYSSQLTSLDVSNNTALTRLWCYSNQLTSLDVSNNTNLEWLNLRGNQVNSIDVSANTALEYLYTHDNPITALDVSNNAALISLYCHNSQLSTLDVSNNPSLINIYCFNNQLTELNVANGNNMNFVQFDATTNPGLTCIQVDDSTYSANNWTNIDLGASFSEDCGYVTGIEEEELIVTSFYPNPAVDQLNVALEKPATAHIVNALSEVKVVYYLYAGNNILDISDLSAGVYFFQTAGGIFKFVKE